MPKKNLIYLVFPLLWCCAPSPSLSYIPQQDNPPLKKVALTETELHTWHHKDIEHDSLPGTSLDRAFSQLLKDRQGEEVIIAVLDMQVDTDHEDLKGHIWTNTGEIEGNGIDDDDNGYIDDVHGWNFLGNPEGENIYFTKYEYTRYVKSFANRFRTVDSRDVAPEQKDLYLNYQRAKQTYQERMVYAKDAKRNADLLFQEYYQADRTLRALIPTGYDLEKLDSLKSITKDSLILEHIVLMQDLIKYDISEDYVKEYKLKSDERIDKLLNMDYNEREITGDNPTDISDTRYGNNDVSGHAGFLDHGTLVAGVIAADRANNIGAVGFSDNFLIMPLCVSAFGDEHDKDIALAIRYAVDNGAKVINMSFGKEFSLYKSWVDEAIQYADQHDVLIVKSASNDGMDLDSDTFFNYPDDMDDKGKELSSNFIKVGSTGNDISAGLLSPSTNYGKESVDIFAPGVDIYTTTPKPEKYTNFNGTSPAAAVVSGIAALLYSYYPDLTARQVKDILLKSGVSYSIECPVPGDKEKKKTFADFSRSGKIINAYNALLMAEKDLSE